MTRATNGESSIYRDGTGRWHGQVSMGRKNNGRRDRRHVSGAKRADVVTRVRELERKRDAGTAGVAGKVSTVEQWLEHWLDTIAAGKVKPSTLTRYRGLVRHQIAPGVGHHRLDRLQPEHVDELYARLLAGGLAPATVLQCHRVLSRALKVARQRDKVARNVCTLVDAPTVERTEVQPLTGEEARRALAAAVTARNGARWAVALALGLRQGEALGLQWSDVDLDAGTLRVRAALQRRPWQHGCTEPERCGAHLKPSQRASRCPHRHGGGLVVTTPKSRAGKRTIILPPQMTEALRGHRAAQVAERLAAGSLWEDHGLVFCQVNGRPLDPSKDHQAWRSLLAAAGVRSAKLHDARHTAATLLLMQGVKARVVMEILGHSQIGLTLGTYSHVMPELARDAADRMGEALWG